MNNKQTLLLRIATVMHVTCPAGVRALSHYNLWAASAAGAAAAAVAAAAVAAIVEVVAAAAEAVEAVAASAGRGRGRQLTLTVGAEVGSSHVTDGGPHLRRSWFCITHATQRPHDRTPSHEKQPHNHAIFGQHIKMMIAQNGSCTECKMQDLIINLKLENMRKNDRIIQARLHFMAAMVTLPYDDRLVPSP